MEEPVKRRGRKKTIINIEENPANVEEPVKKKRGRKKKWETTPFKNNYNSDGTEPVKFEESSNFNDSTYNINALNFGNLCIKVHDKETEQNTSLQNYFISNKDNCDIYLSSDEEDTCNVKKDHSKDLKIYTNNVDTTEDKLKIRNIRCFNCHHNFDNPPFFLPFDYSSTLNRYKLYGNFCSPNCVKSYALSNKIFEHKSYLVGQFYRKLFGPNFKITPSPSIYNLIDYGGEMSIEEFRKSSYTNSRYTLCNLNSKVIYMN